MNPRQVLNNEANMLIDDFIRVYDSKGMRASGRWAESLRQEVEVTETNLKMSILGEDYTQQLESGRRPNNVTRGSDQERRLIAFLAYGSIGQWVIDKGVDIPAWLVAQKIVREGWDRRDHGGLGIVSDVFTPQRIQSIIDKIGLGYIEEFTDIIIKQLRDANRRNT